MASCSKEGQFTQLSTNQINEDNSVLVRRGLFAPTSGIEVMGYAEIRMSDGSYYVKLSEFSISAGPDLKVYLSPTASPSEFVNLGSLQTNKSVYPIPDGIQLSNFGYVLVHCQQYDHLFAISNPTE
jgi:hypothetical protein